MKSKLKLVTFLTAMVMAVVGICACLTGCEGNVGTICTLEEAYEQGLVTTEDLKSIAYYHNLDRTKPEGYEEDKTFTPLPKDPEELSAKTEKKIKMAYRKVIREGADFPLDRLMVSGYYGTYKSRIVVRIKDNSIKVSFSPDLPEYEEIGGVAFFHYRYNLYVWSK